MKQRVRFIVIPIFILLAACNAAAEPGPPDCDSGRILIAPTATRQTDPDLSSPPGPPPPGDDGAVYCPTPVAVSTLTADAPEQFVAAEVINLSLDIANQDLTAAAVGDDMLAVAWLSEGDVYVALSRGGNHFQARRVDRGANASLTFSKVNRLHLAYEQDGRGRGRRYAGRRLAQRGRRLRRPFPRRQPFSGPPGRSGR